MFPKRFFQVLIAGLLVAGFLAPLSAMGATWQTAQQSSNQINYNPPNWVIAQDFDGNINNIGAPEWVVAETFQGQLSNYSEDWVDAQVMTNNVNVQGAPEWVHAQAFTVNIDCTNGTWLFAQSFVNEIDTQPEWMDNQNFTSEMNSRENIYYNPDSPNWIPAVVFLVILWLPGLIMGWFAPTYGTVIGVCIMGAIMLFQDSTFIFVFIMILINGAVMFWKSGGDG